MKRQKINKKMSFMEVMRKNPDAIEVLLDKGMHCMGCGMAMQETLEDGAIAHGLDADELVKEINAMVKCNKVKKK